MLCEPAGAPAPATRSTSSERLLSVPGADLVFSLDKLQYDTHAGNQISQIASLSDFLLKLEVLTTLACARAAPTAPCS